MDQLDRPAKATQAPQCPQDLTDPPRCATALCVAEEAVSGGLEQHARHAQGALAPETERALRKAALAFTSWTTAQGLMALPAAPEMVAAYVDALAVGGRKPASIRQAVWAIATL